MKDIATLIQNFRDSQDGKTFLQIYGDITTSADEAHHCWLDDVKALCWKAIELEASLAEAERELHDYKLAAEAEANRVDELTAAASKQAGLLSQIREAIKFSSCGFCHEVSLLIDTAAERKEEDDGR